VVEKEAPATPTTVARPGSVSAREQCLLRRSTAQRSTETKLKLKPPVAVKVPRVSAPQTRAEATRIPPRPKRRAYKSMSPNECSKCQGLGEGKRCKFHRDVALTSAESDDDVVIVEVPREVVEISD
jgi:hypothetical protein